MKQANLATPNDLKEEETRLELNLTRFYKSPIAYRNDKGITGDSKKMTWREKQNCHNKKLQKAQM